MKTFKTTQLAILILLFAVYSCQKKPAPELLVPPPVPDVCPTNDPKFQGQKINKNQFIVKIDPCIFENNPAYRDTIIQRFLDLDYYVFKTCECDPTLILFQTDNPPVDEEERLGEGNDKLVAEGKDLGSAIYNFSLKLIDMPERDTLSYQYYAPKTYNEEFESKVTVAVIDGGINQSELSDYLWDKPDGVCGDDHGLDLTGSTPGYNNHGSWVSELIVRGMNPLNIKLMDLRIFDEYGDGDLFNGICAMSYAIKNGADIINTSWGYYDTLYDPTLFEYVKEARNNDIIVVGSAGNDHVDTDECYHFVSSFDHKMYHKDITNVIGVAYLNDAGDELHDDSNWGKKSVSLAAEGIYGNSHGSSFAAPRVTRAIAIIKGEKPELNHRKVIKCLLKNNVDKIGLPVESNGKLKEGILTGDCE